MLSQFFEGEISSTLLFTGMVFLKGETHAPVFVDPDAPSSVLGLKRTSIGKKKQAIDGLIRLVKT